MNIGTYAHLVVVLAILTLTHQPSLANDREASMLCGPGISFEKRQLAGDRIDDICGSYAGKVMLIVNTASRCGFTYQYEGLETLYDRYREAGLVVLGFPSNDFGGQEPGSEDQIQDFCVNTYAIKFPMYEKTRVKGNNIDPLYQALIHASGSKPRWNFQKYLVDRNGKVVAAYAGSTKPLSSRLVNKIESLLKQDSQKLSLAPGVNGINRVTF